MNDLNELNQMLGQLTKLSAQATTNANNALNGIKNKIPQKDYFKLKKLTNFENINTELEILERIEDIKAWAQQSQD